MPGERAAHQHGGHVVSRTSASHGSKRQDQAKAQASRKDTAPARKQRSGAQKAVAAGRAGSVTLPRLFDSHGEPASEAGMVQGLFDALPFYVMLVDARHHVLLANKAVYDKLAVEPRCLLGAFCPKMVHGLRPGQVYPGCPLEEAVTTGASVEREYDDPKNGRVTLSWIYPTVYRSENGAPVFLHTTTEITAQRRAEALQREHQRVAESRERMARIGEISAGVAHTVRNPLHGVMSCVELVTSQAQRGEPASAELLGLMRDGLERIEKITRRLLALTREVPPELRPTRIGDLLGDAVDLMAVQASKKSMWIDLEIDFAAEVMVDADRVMEGLISVLSNSLDASAAGGRVVVRSRLDTRPNPMLVVEVEDQGTGIAAEHLPRVLDPFFTTKPIGEGSGLGLAITRRVMDEHGGEVQIDSVLGRGTIVRLLFPQPLAGQRAEPAGG